MAAGVRHADPRIDRYLAKDRPWRAELIALREILLSEGPIEALKWRKPCYGAHGRNLLILAAMKDSVAVSFFAGVLLTDPDGRLQAPGKNSRSARYMKFSGLADIENNAPRLRAFVQQAIGHAKDGIRVDLPKDDFDYPDELVAAMDDDPRLAEAFAALTPGRQRGWVLQFSAPKQAATRVSRIAKAHAAILSSKGPHDR
jgi:uncharacterized protein YdeI (YjbR/CyaY-like superfamily)